MFYNIYFTILQYLPLQYYLYNILTLAGRGGLVPSPQTVLPELLENCADQRRQIFTMFTPFGHPQKTSRVSFNSMFRPHTDVRHDLAPQRSDQICRSRSRPGYGHFRLVTSHDITLTGALIAKVRLCWTTASAAGRVRSRTLYFVFVFYSDRQQVQ